MLKLLEITDDNFPNLWKETGIQTQEVQRCKVRWTLAPVAGAGLVGSHTCGWSHCCGVWGAIWWPSESQYSRLTRRSE